MKVWKRTILFGLTAALLQSCLTTGIRSSGRSLSSQGKENEFQMALTNNNLLIPEIGYEISLDEKIDLGLRLHSLFASGAVRLKQELLDIGPKSIGQMIEFGAGSLHRSESGSQSWDIYEDYRYSHVYSYRFSPKFEVYGSPTFSIRKSRYSGRDPFIYSTAVSFHAGFHFQKMFVEIGNLYDFQWAKTAPDLAIGMKI